MPGEHIVEAGLQRDAFKLRTRVSNTVYWLGGDAGLRFSAFNGDTTLTSAWAQRRVAHRAAMESRDRRPLRALARVERLDRRCQRERAAALRRAQRIALLAEGGALVFADRPVDLKGLGRPCGAHATVAELYQGSISSTTIVINDPNLKPEKSWTGELTVERNIGVGLLLATVFHERTTDALYSQKNLGVTPNVTNIQNVDAIRTTGLELAAQANDFGLNGLALSSSLTYAHSIIMKNDKFPASVGRWQPRVPNWRAALLATYRPNARWSFTGGERYSGRQYGTLDNSDPNGATYMGVSRFLVADMRVQYRIDRQWPVAVGVDNLGNRTYWAFHPYTQRTFYAELRFDL